MISIAIMVIGVAMVFGAVLYGITVVKEVPLVPPPPPIENFNYRPESFLVVFARNIRRRFSFIEKLDTDLVKNCLLIVGLTAGSVLIYKFVIGLLKFSLKFFTFGAGILVVMIAMTYIEGHGKEILCYFPTWFNNMMANIMVALCLIVGFIGAALRSR